MSEEKENNTKKNPYSCLKSPKNLFLSKNQRLNQIGYAVFIALFFLIFSFQNCKEGNINNGSLDRTSDPVPSQTTTSTTRTDPTY